MKQDDEDYEYNDGEEITACEKCGNDYDEIDADFLICSRCGWDAEKKRHSRAVGNRSMKGYGIDPDVTHRINSGEL